MDNKNYKILIDNEDSQEPFFSVAVLTYNACDLVGKALKSIYNQTYSDFELVLIDDGSNDNTDAIVNSNKDKRLRYIKNGTNKGVGISRDLAIDVSKGKYIVFVDVDDVVDRDLLLNLKNEIDKHNPDFIIYGFEERYIANKNKAIWAKQRLPYKSYCEYKKKNSSKDSDIVASNNIENDRFFNDSETIKALLIYLENDTILGYPWNKCYKKQIIKDNNIHFENINIYEDIFFNLDYYKQIKCLALLNKVLYTYNNKHNNKSLTKKDYDNYFELSKNRVKRVYETIKEWNKLDFNSLNILKRIYIRYSYSELNRCINRKYTRDKLLSRLAEIRNDELFENILDDIDKCQSSDIQKTNETERLSFNKIMQDCFVKKKKRQVLFVARMINFVSKYMYNLYLTIAK